MINDRQASELVSKSLRQRLGQEEESQVEQHLRTNPSLRAFAKISELIQNSLTDIGVMAASGDETIAPGIPHDVRVRLKDSVSREVLRLSRDETAASNSTEPFSADIQLAATLLERGQVTEDRIAAAITSWDKRSGTLGQHLVEQKIITNEQCQQTADEIGAVQAGSSAADTLKNDEQTNTFIDPGTSNSISRISAMLKLTSTTDSEILEMRHVVSRYSLIRKLGEGGLGKVWLARDEKLKRIVAIKEIDANASESPRSWQRFHREAEITGHLEHPNVVPLYQFGTDPKRGQPFYAMRFVGKRTLADAISEYHEQRLDGEDDTLDLHRLLNAFLDVCQAIAYAHSRGVVHRDLKPENVALDTFGQVVVLDWGLAKLTDDGELNTRLTIGQHADESSLVQTLAGEVVGTPLYMAPEQAAGDLDNIDERTDIFGLGAILFAILTGCAPHEKSRRKEASDMRSILDAIANAETPTASDFNANVPTAVAKICRKAMARKAYARHKSATELANDVERWMAGQSRKMQQFEDIRIEGRELCANLQSCIRDLGTNARFMAILPPIQGIIDARMERSGESEEVWRERLITIFHGLLQANSDYAAVTYYQCDEDSAQEIVRVERGSSDAGNIRSVPKSRLASCPISTDIERIVRQKPEDVTFQFKSIHDGSPRRTNFEAAAGVPVFDQHSEDLFGFIAVESDLNRVLDRELRDRIRVASEVIIMNDQTNVLVHDCRSRGRRRESVGKPIGELLVNDAERILDGLANQSEFLDESNREIYATRLCLERGSTRLAFILTQRE